MGYSIQKHLEYNAWANGKIVEFLKNIDEQLVDRELQSSFSTLRKTVYHIWDVEIIWFKRIQGEAATTWPSEDTSDDFFSNLDRFLKNSKDLCLFLSDKKRDFLEQNISYTNTKGLHFTHPVEDILYHLVNHSTFHRGQLVTMLRELGYHDFQPQDIIAYIRQQQAVHPN